MNTLKDVPTNQLRDAARAWRNNDAQAALHHSCSGWFRWLTPEPNMTVHDRIDDLIDEIERLRS